MRGMSIRNRVRTLRMVPASDLRPNPKNWRTHPRAQQDALRAVLAEIGLADACLARELPDGTLMLIDGHLRAETLGTGDVPVLILDVTEAEADKLLLLLDPLAGMAGTNATALSELLRGVATGEQSLAELFEDMAADAGIIPADRAEETEGDDDPTEAAECRCPRCGEPVEDSHE